MVALAKSRCSARGGGCQDVLYAAWGCGGRPADMANPPLRGWFASLTIRQDAAWPEAVRAHAARNVFVDMFCGWIPTICGSLLTRRFSWCGTDGDDGHEAEDDI